MRQGTKADLARELNISRAAVSQAFKRHNIQIGADGRFDLDYGSWILRVKQDAAKSQAQRTAKKQVAGLQNPRLKREVIRLLWPIWDEAIQTILRERAADGLDAETWDDLEKYLEVSMLLWHTFHGICDRELPPDIGDFSFRVPDCLDFDFLEIHPRAQIEKILYSVSQLPPNVNDPIDNDALENGPEPPPPTARRYCPGWPGNRAGIAPATRWRFGNRRGGKMSLVDVDNHKRMLAIMSAGLPMPRDLADWYQNAVNRHINEGLPLCLCLRIRGAGIRSEKTRELLRRRDILLNAMQGSVYAPCGSTLWQRSCIAADMLRRYPRSRNEHSLLPHIFGLGVRVPTSKNGVFERIVKIRKCPPYSASKKSR